MSKLTAVVVGLGQVGQGYDYESQDDSVILTHAAALDAHPSFELVGGVDTARSKREQFEKKYARPTYATLGECCAGFCPDVISIAVPTAAHSRVFHEALSHQPKALVLEKPVASSIGEAEKMLEAAARTNCPVSVNYLRRFNPALRELKQSIDDQKLGTLYKGVAWYTKGLVENGTHFLDLFHWILGEVTSIEVVTVGRRWNNVDPEPDLCLRFGETTMHLLAGREEEYSMGRFDLVGTNGVVQYEDGHPIRLSYSQEDPIYPSYRNLSETYEIKNPGDRNIFFVYENLVRSLLESATVPSNLQTATSTLRLVRKIVEHIEGI